MSLIPAPLIRIFFMALFFQALASHGQSNAQVFHDNDFNWTISVPRGFKNVPDTLWAKMQNKGAAAIENTYDVKVENQAHTIFVFNSDQFNYFEANYQPFDSSSDGDYQEAYKSVSDVIYGTLKSQMPNARLDSSYSRETVGGKEFYVFKMAAQLNPQMTMRMLMYSRLFGKKEFSVNIMYVDEAKGKAVLDAWKASTFDK